MHEWCNPIHISNYPILLIITDRLQNIFAIVVIPENWYVTFTERKFPISVALPKDIILELMYLQSEHFHPFKVEPCISPQPSAGTIRSLDPLNAGRAVSEAADYHA